MTYKGKSLNWSTVLQTIQAWHWYLLGFWWGTQKLFSWQNSKWEQAYHRKRERERTQSMGGEASHIFIQPDFKITHSLWQGQDQAMRDPSSWPKYLSPGPTLILGITFQHKIFEGTTSNLYQEYKLGPHFWNLVYCNLKLITECYLQCHKNRIVRSESKKTYTESICGKL